MTRKHALIAIRVAAYHNDDQAAIRAYVENRVSRQAFEAERQRGIAMRGAGVPCSCYQCKKAA